MLASIPAATLLGVDGQPVWVEVHVASGLPGYHVVGLPDAAGRESRERVRAALLSSELDFPLKRITVNLAPGGVRKTGRRARARDRARAPPRRVASCPRAASTASACSASSASTARSGPCPARSCSPTRCAAPAIETLIVPARERRRGLAAPGRRTSAPRGPSASCASASRASCPGPTRPPPDRDPDTDDPVARRTRSTSPTCAASRPRASRSRSRPRGRTTSSSPARPAPARRCSPAACRRSSRRSIPTRRSRSPASSRSPAACRPDALARHRPFRAPHHTASTAALVGGGSGRPRPGEVTLAHRGVLFLDELGEFPPAALDALRQPLEERVVRISRAGA